MLHLFTEDLLVFLYIFIYIVKYDWLLSVFFFDLFLVFIGLSES